MKLIALASVILLSACATSGVVPVGQDTFMITKQGVVGFQSGSSLKAELFPQAVAHCAKAGKELQPVSDSVQDGVAYRNNPSAELTFRCLAVGDLELGRPTPKPYANVRVEQVKAPESSKRGATMQNDPYAELVRLKELLDAKIITQDEFDVQKQKFFAR